MYQINRKKNSISSQCCISKPLENNKPPKFFLCFYGSKETHHFAKMVSRGWKLYKATFFYSNNLYLYKLTHFSLVFSLNNPENRKQKRFSDVFRDIHIEMEHCLKLVNNYVVLAAVIDKQNWNIYPSDLLLREKCPNTEFLMVRIFLYSDWIRRFTP